MNETVKAYLASKGHPAQEVEGVHRAWCQPLQLHLALWAAPYTANKQAPGEW
jgi:hypothetical protein